MSLLSSLDRFNQRHPWSHNDLFARWVATTVADSGARTVLDIGCGTGNLVDVLKRRSEHVTAFEPDSTCAHVAGQRFADCDDVTIVHASFEERDFGQRWDAITLVAVLHHLPLAPTLAELRECLNPGGRLVIVGCYREQGWADATVGWLSLAMNPMFGFIRNPRRANQLPDNMTAPIYPPQETLVAIKHAIERELPGSRVRRRMFWRYTAVCPVPE